nr:MAG TPA: hypothetical protein [Bacteriophage sp.]
MSVLVKPILPRVKTSFKVSAILVSSFPACARLAHVNVGESRINTDTAGTAQIAFCDFGNLGGGDACNPDICGLALHMLGIRDRTFDCGIVCRAPVTAVNDNRFAGMIPDVFQQFKQPFVNLHKVGGILPTVKLFYLKMSGYVFLFIRAV